MTESECCYFPPKIYIILILIEEDLIACYDIDNKLVIACSRMTIQVCYNFNAMKVDPEGNHRLGADWISCLQLISCLTYLIWTINTKLVLVFFLENTTVLNLLGSFSGG